MSRSAAQKTTMDRTRPLRRALLANAWFSAASALVLILGAGPVAAWMGVPSAGLLRVLGVALALFAAGLAWIARSDPLPRALAVGATLSDAAWVLGSAVLVLGFPEQLTVAGRWTVMLVAFVVAVMGAAQAVGLRRSRSPLRS
ncbi:MAG: hypothetical protein R3266_06780 [Gemmatimonadota bacterium]|nr:hypothetical protein [Gemmatimonadota bacterium]